MQGEVPKQTGETVERVKLTGTGKAIKRAVKITGDLSQCRVLSMTAGISVSQVRSLSRTHGAEDSLFVSASWIAILRTSTKLAYVLTYLLEREAREELTLAFFNQMQASTAVWDRQSTNILKLDSRCWY
jgi:hypothetical protein